jgi:hypothetical protein
MSRFSATRQVVQKVELLEYEADVIASQGQALLRFQVKHGLAEKAEFSAEQSVEHAENVQQRAFPGPRRTHDRHELA